VQYEVLDIITDVVCQGQSLSFALKLAFFFRLSLKFNLYYEREGYGILGGRFHSRIFDRHFQSCGLWLSKKH